MPVSSAQPRLISASTPVYSAQPRLISVSGAVSSAQTGLINVSTQVRGTQTRLISVSTQVRSVQNLLISASTPVSSVQKVNLSVATLSQTFFSAQGIFILSVGDTDKPPKLRMNSLTKGSNKNRCLFSNEAMNGLSSFLIVGNNCAWRSAINRLQSPGRLKFQPCRPNRSSIHPESGCLRRQHKH